MRPSRLYKTSDWPVTMTIHPPVSKILPTHRTVRLKYSIIKPREYETVPKVATVKLQKYSPLQWLKVTKINRSSSMQLYSVSACVMETVTDVAEYVPWNDSRAQSGFIILLISDGQCGHGHVSPPQAGVDLCQI